MKRIFITIIILLALQTLAYSKTLLIEMSAIIDNVGNVDSGIDSIIRSYKYKSQEVSIVSFAPVDINKEAIIKNIFLISKIYYGKEASKKILSSKKRVKIYAQSDEMITLLDKNNMDYVQVINNLNTAHSIEEKYLLRLKNKSEKPIFIANDIKEIIGVKVDKNKIVVLDGDTIVYNDVRYRILGVDAPEMEQTPHGDIAKSFVEKQIENSSDVYINVCSLDIYDRVLAHIFIDEHNLSYTLLTNKLAIQNVTTYGDNGFEEVAQAILHYSKNNRKRLPFKSPAQFRKDNRKNDAEE